MSADKLNDVLAEVQQQFPGAELEDLRGGQAEDAAAAQRAREELRPVQESNLRRMKLAAIGEATRIELAQLRLVESGRLQEPSEKQLQLRDDFDALVRLVELIEEEPAVLALIVQKRKPVT